MASLLSQVWRDISGNRRYPSGVEPSGESLHPRDDGLRLRRVITKKRIMVAFSVAVVVDVCQILLGPLGWVLPDEVLDVLAMVITVWALGFHPLLLPTFILELFPVVDMVPTWTACVAAVVLLRRSSIGSNHPTPPASPPNGGGPVYSETGQREPPPLKEPKPIKTVE